MTHRICPAPPRWRRPSRALLMPLLGALAGWGCMGPQKIGAPPPTEGGDADERIDPSSASPSKGQSATLDRLAQDTGTTWELALHARYGTPRLLAGGAALVGAGAADAAIHQAVVDFLGRYPELYQLADASAELVAAGVERDELGMAHARLGQRFDGLPVRGSTVVAHVDAQGTLQALSGRFTPIKGLDPRPALTSSEAMAIGLARRQELAPLATDADLAAPPSASLEIEPPSEEGAPARLVWTYRSMVDDGREPLDLEVLIDAQSGELLAARNLIAFVRGSGRGVLGDTKPLVVTLDGGAYWLADFDTLADGIYTVSARDGEVVSSGDPNRWDTSGYAPGAAVDAHYHAELVAQYLASVVRRDGLDGRGGSISSQVHYGNGYNNAFWNGRQMVYGDGDGSYFRALSAGLDVCAHELGHGLTQYTSGLYYQGQSGALNESFSDVFGSLVEHWARSGGGDWAIGREVYTPGRSGDALRDMQVPERFGQPGHLSEYVRTSGDNGGVHVNSGIPNQAFYLLAAGGQNPVSGMTTTGIGDERAGAVWVRAHTRYLAQRADFEDMALATVRSARDLYGDGSTEMAATRRAWQAVGVLAGSEPAPSGGGGGSGGGDAEEEPNDGSDQADAIPLGGARSGALGRSGDVDWFWFRLDAQRDIDLALEQLSVDYDLELYSSRGTLLARSEQGGRTAEHVTGEASAGVYLVRVYGYQGSAGGGYRVSVR